MPGLALPISYTARLGAGAMPSMPSLLWPRLPSGHPHLLDSEPWEGTDHAFTVMEQERLHRYWIGGQWVHGYTSGGEEKRGV